MTSLASCNDRTYYLFVEREVSFIRVAIQATFPLVLQFFELWSSGIFILKFTLYSAILLKSVLAGKYVFFFPSYFKRFSKSNLAFFCGNTNGNTVATTHEKRQISIHSHHPFPLLYSSSVDLMTPPPILIHTPPHSLLSSRYPHMLLG